MHYSFKSTPTYTMKGRPHCNNKLIQPSILIIQDLPII